MGRIAENVISEHDLFEFWCGQRKLTDGAARFRSPREGDHITMQRKATIYGMHQFDPRMIWMALQGLPLHQPDRKRARTAPTLYDLVRHDVCLFDGKVLIRKTDGVHIVKGVELGEAYEVDKDDFPVKVPLAIRVAAGRRIRDWQKLLAMCLREFRVTLSKTVPADDAEGSAEDPVSASARALSFGEM